MLDERISLPPGPVQVTVVPLPELPVDDSFWQILKGIWQGQRARGHVPRGSNDVEAERRMMREQWEERMRRIDQIQEEGRRIRKTAGPGT